VLVTACKALSPVIVRESCTEKISQSSKADLIMMEPRVGNKYRLGRKIGSGSFGEIYLGMLRSLNLQIGDGDYQFDVPVALHSLSILLCQIFFYLGNLFEKFVFKM
jgi:hypothetical protein